MWMSQDKAHTAPLFVCFYMHMWPQVFPHSLMLSTATIHVAQALNAAAGPVAMGVVGGTMGWL